MPAQSPSGDLTRFPGPNAKVPQVVAAVLETILADSSPPASRPRRAADQDSPQPSTIRSETAPNGEPGAGAVPWIQAGSFFRLGMFHIATGLDHLVFLLGLMAAQRGWRDLLWVITAFTLAHSLSLALAAAGLILVPGVWVEPAIGATIAYVGLASLLSGLRHGPWLAFAFGLIHGLGFAGALTQALAGLPVANGAWLLALAAFNLGIETVQLGLVLLALTSWHALRVLEFRPPRILAPLPALVVATLGFYWTLQPALALIGGPS